MLRILSLFLVFQTSIAFAQTTLPTSWDFASTPATLPTGWTTNTTSSYSSGLPDNSGGSSKAGKLQNTGHHFTINFFDEPGVVSYNLRAYSSNGANFSGTFRVEESVNGSSWTTVQQFNSNDFGNQWDLFSDSLNVDSRYVRFYFSNKVSGINVGLDDVTVTPFQAVDGEINVQYDGADVPSGNTIQFASAVNNSLEVNLIVQNLGSQGTLSISNVGISGPALADYLILDAPASVSPQSEDTIKVSFTPSAAGNRLAELEITNSDSNESPYLIQLQGIGGSGASEPSSNPSSLVVETLKSYRVKTSFESVGSDGYLVLANRNAQISGAPTDGSSYEIGEGIGNAKVVHIGSAAQFWIREASAWDTFYVAVYAFNGSGGFENYRTNDPLIDSIITPIASMEDGNYYSGVDVNQTSFIDDLHDVINPHTTRFYSDYEEWMIPRLLARDTTGGSDVVTCVYSDDDVVFTPPFGWPQTNMNREHTLPASWMPSNGNSGTQEYQDYHHLFPTISTANSQRGNDPLGEVSNVTSSYGKGKRGTNSSGQTVYEPKDGQKGDAARAIFYMMTAYHDPSNGDSWAFEDLASEGPNQKQAVLIEWHLNDPPSGDERARNDYLDSLQKNRNPFIDSSHWVCYIDFKTMTYKQSPDSSCLERAMVYSKEDTPIDTSDSTIGVQELDESDMWIHYPNPVNDLLYVGNVSEGSFDMTVSNVEGRLVERRTLVGLEAVNLQMLPSGIYFVRLSNTTNQYSFKLMKQ